jgi:PIN domain nuclease of toxin-antitoxin system
VERGGVIVLDTHAWIWWAAEPRRLSVRAREAIAEADSLGVSAISCWEVAMLVAKGRLELDRDVLVWLRQALGLPRVVALPLSPETAVAAARLPEEFPGDPADRMITASALENRSPVVSKDARLRGWSGLRTIW